MLATLSVMAPVPPVTTSPHTPVSHASIPPEAKPFDANRDAKADIDAALGRAKASGKRVIAVFGANWCHDSTALAGWLETPRFKAMLAAKFEVIYVDAGMPQTGAAKNLTLFRRLGLKDIKGTPTVMILSGEGALLNASDAPKWRNAASRKGDDIFAHFENFETTGHP